MSYEIVKKISIRDNKVFLTSTSNNVSPRTYKEWHCQGLTEILQNSGETELNFELLKEYENGNFQEGTPNKWSTAIKRLKYSKEYKAIAWRLSDYSDNCPIQAARRSEEYRRIVLSSLELKSSAVKYILKKETGNGPCYVLRETTRVIKYTGNISQAKIYNYIQEAENLKEMFDFLQIIPLKTGEKYSPIAQSISIQHTLF